MEKTLELRVKAIIGPEMAKLQRDLASAGLLGGAAGRTGAAAGRDIEQGFQRADRAAKGFNNTIQNSTKYLQLIKGVISAFLLYRGFTMLTGQASQFVRTLVDVQHQVGLIQTQLSATGKDFRGDISKNIMRIAGDTGMAMESLAKTEYEIISANIKLADSYDILNLSARAAVAGGLKDAEQAFDAALSQVNTFNISFEKAFDLQFQTLKRGIFNYEQFTTVVGTLSEAFASMGQEAETANASLAAISQVFTGKQLERGATGLRNAVLRISEAPEDFERLGITVTDANGEFRNFIDIAQDLERVLASMSSSERATVIRDLFPDERERRGIGAFLGELDKAEQFFVEQKFAADTLNDAYETANDSLLTQANIFEQDLVPAMQPFVDLMGGLLTVFNGIDAVIPGLNKNLLTTATIGAVIGGGLLMSGSTATTGQFRLASRFAGPAFGAGGMKRMPTGLGYAAGGLMAATAFSAGRQSGAAQPGDYFGSALGGAATGAMIGGPWGAAAGAAVSLIAVALGDAFETKSPEVAASFSDAFSQELENRTGGIAEAFMAALGREIEGEGGDTGVTLRKRGSTSGRYGTESEQDQLREILRRGGTVTITKEPAFAGENITLGASRQTRLQGEGDIEKLNALIDKRGIFLGGVGSMQAETFLGEEQRRSVIRDRLAGPQGFQRFRELAVENAPVEAAYSGQTPEQFLESTTQQGVADLTSDLTSLGRTTAVSMGLFAQAVADSKVEMSDLDQALDILGEGTLEQQKAFLVFIGAMEDGTATFKKTMETVAIHFESLFSGDAALAAEVFSHMGAEGEKLAAVFNRISQTTQAFGMLQQMEAMKMTVTTKRLPTLEEFAAGAGYGAKSSGQLKGAYDQLKRMGALNPISVTTDKSVLEKLGIDPVAAGQMITDRLVADLGLVKGQFGTQDFVNALFKTAEPAQKIVEPLELASNDFADALFQAADAVRFGVLDSAVYTADQLEMFAEEFKDLNRMVRQKALLEQLKGIADFAGVGDKGVSGAMDILRAEMVRSGKALFDLMSDPASLAELIAKMEFGDVTVDNRTTQTIVVRYERGAGGDTGDDIEQAQRIANLIVQKMREN